MKKVPKYVIDLVRRRTKAAEKFVASSIEVDKYCKKIGLDTKHELFGEACLCTDIRIWCEADHGEGATLSAIAKVLEGKKNEYKGKVGGDCRKGI